MNFRASFTYISIFLLFHFTSLSNAAERMNYIEASQLRLTSSNNTSDWIIPFYQNPLTSEKQLSTKTFALRAGFFGSSNHLLPSIYSDIKKQDVPVVIEKLDNQFGSPLDALAKVFVETNWRQYTLGLSVNAGGSLIQNNPTFPQIDGFGFYNAAINFSRRLDFFVGSLTTIKITTGFMHSSRFSVNLGDIIDDSVDVRVDKQPADWFMNLSLKNQYTSDYGVISMEANSLPLFSNKYFYWNTNLGYRSPTFLNNESSLVLHNLSFYGLFSPFYGGRYKIKDTIKLGTSAGLTSIFALDLFTTLDFIFGAYAKFRYSIFEISAFSLQQNYDILGLQSSRSHGISFSFVF